MNPLATEFLGLLREFQTAMNAAGPAAGAVLKVYQPRFTSWAGRARQSNDSRLAGAIMLAEDIADQSMSHTGSLMARVNEAVQAIGNGGSPGAAPAAASGGKAWWVILLLGLFLLK